MLIKYKFSILIAAVIWVVCLIPIPETPLDNVRFIDKWTHFVMYGTLTLAIWYEYYRSHRRSSDSSLAGNFSWTVLVVVGIVLPAIMGCLVEVAQATLTTCRSGDVFDALCNALGTLLAATIAATVILLKRK